MRFAPDFQQGIFPAQPIRDAANRGHVCRDVLAGLAVAPRGGQGELAGLVSQVDRDAVELELGPRNSTGRIPALSPSSRRIARIELFPRRVLVSVSVRIESIGTAWRTGSELLARRAAHAAGWASPAYEARMFPLQLLHSLKSRSILRSVISGRSSM
jgi:hypothetical protein